MRLAGRRACPSFHWPAASPQCQTRCPPEQWGGVAVRGGHGREGRAGAVGGRGWFVGRTRPAAPPSNPAEEKSNQKITVRTSRRAAARASPPWRVAAPPANKQTRARRTHAHLALADACGGLVWRAGRGQNGQVLLLLRCILWSSGHPMLSRRMFPLCAQACVVCECYQDQY